MELRFLDCLGDVLLLGWNRSLALEYRLDEGHFMDEKRETQGGSESSRRGQGAGKDKSWNPETKTYRSKGSHAWVYGFDDTGTGEDLEGFARKCQRSDGGQISSDIS
jgi:hypothetical protein